MKVLLGYEGEKEIAITVRLLQSLMQELGNQITDINVFKVEEVPAPAEVPLGVGQFQQAAEKMSQEIGAYGNDAVTGDPLPPIDPAVVPRPPKKGLLSKVMKKT